jgi:uncharacterized membrane-anchored protein
MKYLELLSIVIYVLVGIISAVMAFKSLSSRKFLGFHEQASVTSWDSIDKSLQSVILALLRVSGLGFLVTALLLLIGPIANYFIHDVFVKYLIPCIALIFCTGLFLVNYKLYKQTKSDTPWKGSLYAVIFILTGVVISLLA